MAFGLIWDEVGKRFFESGVDRGVLYPSSGSGKYASGVAWNGLINVNESNSGAEETPLWADNMKYASLRSAEECAGTIEAYYYPDAFAECDGSRQVVPGVYATQQERKMFGLSYRSGIGNDTEGLDLGYKIHVIYGCTASVSQKNHNTKNESPEAITMSWEFKATPVAVTTEYNGELLKPTAHLIIDSTKVSAEKMKLLEEKLYGNSSDAQPTLPTPDEIFALLKDVSHGA